jgi:protein O-GlcNAc transferase
MSQGAVGSGVASVVAGGPAGRVGTASHAVMQPDRQAAKQAHKAWERGVALARQKRYQEAADCFSKSTQLCPQDSLYWLNLGNVLSKLHRSDEALHAARKALEFNAYNTVAAQLAAKLLRDRNDREQALEVLLSVPKDAQVDAMHHVLVGACLTDLGKPVEAAQSFLSALTLKPDCRDAHIQLGLSLAKLRRHGDAAECFRTILAMEPDSLDAALYALHYASWACDWDKVDRDINALVDCIDQLNDHTAAHAISPFCLLSVSDDAPMLRSLSEWDMRRFVPLPEPMTRTTRERKPGERLRVGMVSSDFHHHATGMLMVELLESIDKARVELFLYSNGPDDGSDLRKRIVASAEHFVECGQMSTLGHARVIQADKIDVLIDLKGFTLDTRISVFSYRPSAVQVAWLGYPGTCGAPFMDYLIGDPVVTPMAHEPFYSERIAQLPHCYQPNDSTRGRTSSRTRAECELPEGAVVFASFNQSYKITREVFDRWCRILARTPDSVLWLLVPDQPVRLSLRQEAQARGIDPDRLIFAEFERIENHRQRLPLADISLDTFPCGGHTTSSDALWAGVPTLAVKGESFASRVAPSLLTAAGLPELICRHLDDYEELAVALAQEPQRLAALKSRLVAARDEAPLYKSQKLATDLVDLLERMWQRADAGLAPQPLPSTSLIPEGQDHE